MRFFTNRILFAPGGSLAYRIGSVLDVEGVERRTHGWSRERHAGGVRQELAADATAGYCCDGLPYIEGVFNGPKIRSVCARSTLAGVKPSSTKPQPLCSSKQANVLVNWHYCLARGTVSAPDASRVLLPREGNRDEYGIKPVNSSGV